MPPNKAILLLVPVRLVDLADEAAAALQISRLAFIRQAIVARLLVYRNLEKDQLQKLLGVEFDDAIRSLDER